MLHGLWTSIRNGSYAVLAATLLAALVIAPFSREQPWLRWLVGVSLLGVTVSALVACWRRQGGRTFVLAMSLGVLSVSADLIDRSGIEQARPYQLTLGFLFLAVVTYVIFFDVMRSKRVTMDGVLGAACVYLLMGLAWAEVFTLLQWADPSSFNLGDPMPAASGFAPMSTDSLMMYYSYITLTTIGYGDITPVTPPARLLSAVEGIVAQLYLAIVVAHLVSQEVTHRLSGRTD